MTYDNVKKYYEYVLRECDKHNITDEYKQIALSVLFYRGARKNVDDFMKQIIILQEKDVDILKSLLLSDKHAGTMVDDLYVYSGTGKDYGIQRMATIAFYFDEKTIARYREIWTEQSKSKADDYLKEQSFELHGKSFDELKKTLKDV